MANQLKLPQVLGLGKISEWTSTLLTASGLVRKEFLDLDIGVPSGLATLDTSGYLTLSQLPPIPHISGLKPANGDGAGGGDATNDITLSAGWAVNSDLTLWARTSASITKRADAAWVIGSGNGGMFTGSFGANSYHCIIIRDNTSGAVDWGFDTSPAGANKPAGWTAIRRVASLKTTGAAWPGFTAVEISGALWIEYKVTTLDVANYSAATTRQVATINVPGGLSFLCIGTESLRYATAAGYSWVRSTNFTDVAPGAIRDMYVDTSGLYGHSEIFVLSDISGQIAHRQSDTGVVFEWLTKGFIDQRPL